MLWLLPILGFGIIWIINSSTVVPVLGLFRLWVLDLLWGEEVPVVLEVSGLDRVTIDQYLVGLVGFDYEGVDVRVDVVLAADVPVDREISD